MNSQKTFIRFGNKRYSNFIYVVKLILKDAVIFAHLHNVWLILRSFFRAHKSVCNDDNFIPDSSLARGGAIKAKLP